MRRTDPEFTFMSGWLGLTLLRWKAVTADRKGTETAASGRWPVDGFDRGRFLVAGIARTPMPDRPMTGDGEARNFVSVAGNSGDWKFHRQMSGRVPAGMMTWEG